MYQKEKVKGKIIKLLSEAMLNLVVCPPPGGIGVLPYMTYIGVCRGVGYGF